MLTIPSSFFGGSGTSAGGLGIAKRDYTPVDLKGNNHRHIYDGLIDNISQFILNKNENIASGKIINKRPNITHFVIQNMDIGELGGWKMIESNLKVEGADIYVQARFPNARTNPKKPEPEIIGFNTRTRKRGTTLRSYNVYELYLYTDAITKSGHNRTFLKQPEALIMSFSNLDLFNNTIKEINKRIKNASN